MSLPWTTPRHPFAHRNEGGQGDEKALSRSRWNVGEGKHSHDPVHGLNDLERATAVASSVLFLLTTTPRRSAASLVLAS